VILRTPVTQNLSANTKQTQNPFAPTSEAAGQQGHLGLISSAPAYARITPGTPFQRPDLPAPAATVGTTAVLAALRLNYDEQMHPD
jgi:hypothetical protein